MSHLAAYFGLQGFGRIKMCRLARHLIINCVQDGPTQNMWTAKQPDFLRLDKWDMIVYVTVVKTSISY